MKNWIPENDTKILRRVGKTGEEAAELSKIAFRIIIQGLKGIDPKTGQTNIAAFTEEVADMLAQCHVSIDELKLDRAFINQRVAYKVTKMHEWEE